MSGQDKIYEMITERMIAQLEAGVVPWRKPWAAAGIGVPRNIKSGKGYRGVNVFLLAGDYTSPWWGTYDQMAEKSGARKVSDNSRRGNHWEKDGEYWTGLKGEKSTVIVFWKRLVVDDKESENGKKVIPMLRYFHVFNAEQVQGIPEKYLAPKTPETVDPDVVLETAQNIHDEYLAREGAPRYRETGNRAFYNLEDGDTITVPARAAFPDERDYHSTRFHEETHSTGHSSRCDRPGVVNFDHFGTGQYAKEELVAEMGASMLMAIAGIETKETFENSAAYVQNWLKNLKDDHKLVVAAAGQAQKAVDHILGVTYEEA